MGFWGSVYDGVGLLVPGEVPAGDMMVPAGREIPNLRLAKHLCVALCCALACSGLGHLGSWVPAPRTGSVRTVLVRLVSLFWQRHSPC